MTDELEGAANHFVAVLQGARMLHAPSRSWQRGVNRVALWSFQNMYSDVVCWDSMRWRKDDMADLAHAVRLPDVIVTPSRGYVFGRMEALVVFLLRMASPAPWEGTLPDACPWCPLSSNNANTLCSTPCNHGWAHPAGVLRGVLLDG